MKKILYIITLGIIFISGCSNNLIDTSLSQEEIDGLNLALQDEYKAESTYQKVIDEFGEVNPFSNIIKAEQKHSSKLIELFEKYNLEIPQNQWYAKVPSFKSVQKACSVEVQAEIENIELYDKIFNSTQKEDILNVYTSLQRASQENHLPAFQRCS
jgi:hypothetical protein